MKKLIQYSAILGICCLVATPGFSQQKPAAKKTLPANTMSADQNKMLCKAWKLDTVSVYGVDKKANAKEANDGITLMADGTLFLTREGEAGTGTWTYSAGHINAVIKDPAKTYSFKIIGLADGRMVLEYQVPAPDLSRIKYVYSPKK
jgi:hypothetical protein